MSAVPVYAVLFDIDGTLLDSTATYFEITRRACLELGWPAPSAQLMREVMTHRRHPVHALFGDVPDAGAREQALTDAAMKLWQPLFSELARPFDDTVAVLDTLHRAGMRLGVVTDSNDFVVAKVAGAPGCPPFDTVVTRERAGARKPSPAGIEIALAELGVAPEAAVYVGDNPCDIEAATAAGVHAVGITTGPSLREDLETCGAHAVIDALSQLPALLAPGAPVINGELATGLGKAGGFLALDWVGAQVRTALGGEFYPGTVNLRLSEAAARLVARHRDDAALVRHEIRPAAGFCRAWCHAVDLGWGGQRVPALTLWPEVDGYAPTQVEIICAPRVRDHWRLADGQRLTVHYRRHGR